MAPPLITRPCARPLPRAVLGQPAPLPARQALGKAGAKPQSCLTHPHLPSGPTWQSPRPPVRVCPRAARDGGQDAPSGPLPPDDSSVADDGPLTDAAVVAQLHRLKAALGALSAAASEATAAVEALTGALQGESAPPPGGIPPMSPTGAFFGGLTGLPRGLPVTAGVPARAPEPAPGTGTSLEGALAAGEGEGTEEGGGAVGVGPPKELAVRLQQAFVQARVEGLGRPPEVALEDFVRLCAEARAQGTPMKELQLQLILAEGSLPAPFGKKALVPGDEGATQEGAGLAVEAEDIRVRTLWVRFVYTTLALVEAIKDGRGYVEVVPPYEGAPPDAMDGYVQQTVRSAIEDGQDLDFVLTQQRSSAPIASPFIRLMRQNQILILIALRNGLAS